MALNFYAVSHIDEALKEYEMAKKRALWKVGAQAERYAKKLCPVVTGRLRNSITHTQLDDAAYIGTNVKYAPYVELGTSKRIAKPYLKPAVQDHKEQYRQIMEEEFLKVSSKYGA